MENNFETEMPSVEIKVRSHIMRFENYKLINLEGEQYILAYGTNYKGGFELSSFKNSVLLYDCLSLHKKISVAPDQLEKEMLSFCKKYGLPEWLSDPSEIFKEYNLFFSVPDFRHGTLCKVSSFLDNLHFLYVDFMKAAAVHEKDYDINHVLNYLLKKDKNKLSDYRKNGNTSLFLPVIMPFKTVWENGSGLVMECDSPLHAAAYYVCILYQKGNIEGVVKICKKCGNIFITNHPQTKYCSNKTCNSKAYYQKKKREKEKA